MSDAVVGAAPAALATELGLSADAAPDWLRSLQETDERADPGDDEALPSVDEARDWLARMGADSVDAEAVLAVLPRWDEPGIGWAVRQCRRQLAAAMGRARTEVPPWPMLPGDFGRLFYVLVFLAAVPAVRRFHAERGIDDETSWASLADLTQQMRVHRAIFGGQVGLHTQQWLKLPFCGLLYSMGRLQFNFVEIDKPVEGAPFEAGEMTLGAHIPETGPLDTAECERSFDRVRDFMAAHFPERPVRYATCGSWLLDPQLAEYLRPESNIIRFQNLFTRMAAPQNPGDKDVLEFVFRVVGDVDPQTLPQRTTLERAVVTHLRSGRHWQVRTGWRALR